MTETSFGTELKNKLLDGVQKLNNSVASTLGPAGRTVLIKDETGDIKVTKDGVTVAKAFQELEDQTESIGAELAKKVSIKSVEQLESGLHYASISPITEPVVDDQAVLAQFPELINVLSQLKEHPQVKSLPLEIDLLSAESVSYQLAGLIPITPMQKQSLLEAFDATQRMNILAKLVSKISESSA